MYITIDVYFLLVKFTNCFVQRSLEFFPCVANGFQPQDLVKSSYADVLAWGVDKLTALSLCRWGLFFFRVWIHVGWVWGQRNGEIHGELGGFDGMLLVNIAMENHPSSGWFAFVYQLFTYQKWRFSGSPCFLYRRVSIAKLLNEPSQSRDLTLTPKAWLGEASAAQCGRAAEREGQSPRAEVEDLDNIWTKWPVI